MNLPYPKRESFDTKGIEGGRSKVTGLKEKLAGGFSRVITLGFFNSSNRAQVLACSSCLSSTSKGASCTLSLKQVHETLSPTQVMT